MNQGAILFVDDEPSILGGFRRMLRPTRDVWDANFAASGAEALELLASKRVDIIVTDMKMPMMDGAELLRQVKTRFPSVIRFVLSGQAERSTVLRSLGVFHQFVSKPCELESLKAKVGACFDLRGLVPGRELREAVNAVGVLPCLPDSLERLLAAFGDSRNPEVDELAAIIGGDPGVAAKILQTANTSFFSPSGGVDSVGKAVTALGVSTIGKIIKEAELFRPIELDAKNWGGTVARLPAHSLAVARLTAAIVEGEGGSPGEKRLAYCCGLLHDVGELLVADQFPEPYAKVVAESVAAGKPRSDCEAAEFGADHAGIGAYLLGIWGLPKTLVAAVAGHHRMECGAGESIIEIAVRCADIIDRGGNGAGWPAAEIRDPGLAAMLERWRGHQATT